MQVVFYFLLFCIQSIVLVRAPAPVAAGGAASGGSRAAGAAAAGSRGAGAEDAGAAGRTDNGGTNGDVGGDPAGAPVRIGADEPGSTSSQEPDTEAAEVGEKIFDLIDAISSAVGAAAASSAAPTDTVAATLTYQTLFSTPVGAGPCFSASSIYALCASASPVFTTFPATAQASCLCYATSSDGTATAAAVTTPASASSTAAAASVTSTRPLDEYVASCASYASAHTAYASFASAIGSGVSICAGIAPTSTPTASASMVVASVPAAASTSSTMVTSAAVSKPITGAAWWGSLAAMALVWGAVGAGWVAAR